LETIIETFMKPLRDNRIISPKDVTVMFSNVEELLALNQVFHFFKKSIFEFH